ncbi:hypothetical protein [Paenibacillus sp. 203]|uniref:hypothetical protein n=1 Tax=Paenibacillus sp. 203 TaxID=3096765 RepID=UPI001F322EBC|nr:hypothetical protein [Paenibacillus sp. UKAQ_18]
MKNSITITPILESMLTPEEVQRVVKLIGPKELLLIDSTTMTVGKTRLPWAPYHGERAGIKLQVALRAENGQPFR